MSYSKNMKRVLLTGVATASLSVALPAVSSTAAYAQDYTSGIINGVIQDTSGSVVAGATITVVSDQGTTRTTTSDSNGNFRIPRLAIGTYTVTVSAAGRDTLTNTQNVGIGDAPLATYTLAIPGAIDTVVAVGVSSGAWDFNSTTSGITVNVDELMDQTPVGRNVTAIALLAPGTTRGDATFGNLASFSGASVAENSYYVNGMNITEYRNFLGSSTIPFDFIQAVDVKTSGYSAEFGRATGGVISNVTRSGSNEFKAGVNVYWTPNFLRSNQKNIQTSINEFEDADSLDYNIWASGPLIKDKLFFAGLYQWRDREWNNFNTSSASFSTDTSAFWGVKFDFEPVDGHRFEATLFDNSGLSRTAGYSFLSSRDTIEFDGNTYGVIRDDINDFTADQLLGAYNGADSIVEYGGLNEIYKYTGVLTDYLTISAMYGKNPANQNRYTDPDTSHLKRIIDSRNGQGFFSVPGYAASTTFGTDTDFRESWRVDADIYFEAAGDHHLRVGIDREKMTSVHTTSVSGGQYWRYYDCNDGSDLTALGAPGETGCIFPNGYVLDGTEYVRDWDQEAGGSFNIIQTAQYIQDAWNVSDDLTLLIGLRNETFDNRNPNNETFIKSKNQLALRLGFNYDPTGDGTQRVFGSYGRSYLPVAGNTNIRNSSAERFILNFYPIAGITNDWEPIWAGGTQPDSLWRWVIDDGVLPNPATKAQIGLKPMYQDEFTLGYEKDFGNGWTGKVTGIYRDLASIIEDIGVNHALAAWGDRNGKDAADIAALVNPNLTGINYIMANPGTDLTYLTDYYTHGGALEEVTLTAEDLGYPKAKRTYTALEFVMDREWDGKWSMNAAWTLSWAKGNTEGSVNSDLGQDDAGLTQDFDLPATLIGADGYTANDRRHRIKVRGAYQIDDNIRVGINATLESPRKFGCFGNLPGDFQLDSAYADEWAYHSQYGADYWFCDGEISPRGSNFKSAWARRVDMQISLNPSFNEDIPGNLTIRADIFNVFNYRGASEITFNKELTQSSLAAPIQQNYWYGQTSSRMSPRSIRITAKYEF